MEKSKAVLTIAGSDSCGGAGIQADIKTMTQLGVYAMSIVTALTAQNTYEVSQIMPVPKEFLRAQIDAVFGDIMPQAVKIGMLGTRELIQATAEGVKNYQAKNIVVDPVIAATSNRVLLQKQAVEALKQELLPLASIVTPNIPEATVLSEIEVKTAEDMEKAAKILYESYGCAVLCKGGHLAKTADDYLYTGGEGIWFAGEKIVCGEVHGTGCTLSSAIASYLALGSSLQEAVRLAKQYVTEAIKQSIQLGKGSRVLIHKMKDRKEEEL